MRQIINEISKGKNIDDNLKKYADGFSEINNKFAYIRLALNYYTFLQMQQDENDVISLEVKDVTDYAVNGAYFYGKHLFDNTSYKKIIAFVFMIRSTYL